MSVCFVCLALPVEDTGTQTHRRGEKWVSGLWVYPLARFVVAAGGGAVRRMAGSRGAGRYAWPVEHIQTQSSAPPLAREPAREIGSKTVVYAVATGVVGAVPVPFLDGLLTELARGAGIRRVAMKHRVPLPREVRNILAGSGATAMTSTSRGRLLKTALSAAFAPFRLATRVEESLGTLFAAALLDRYLGRRERPVEMPLTVAEARRIRSATERAVTRFGFALLSSAPLDVFDGLARATRAVLEVDEGEERTPVERFFDEVLDGLADVPGGLMGRLGEQFDEVLEGDDD